MRRTPEQLAKALAAAQAEVEALKLQVAQLQGGGGDAGNSSSRSAGKGSDCGGDTGGGKRPRMPPGRKWALVGGLQLAGFVAYMVAAERMGCV